VTSLSEVVLRPFAPADQPVLRRLVLDGLGDHWGVIDETLNPDLDDIAGWYGPVGGYTVVACAGPDGEIVGGGTLHRDGALADRTGRLVRMSVERTMRGRGLGRRLVEHLVAEAARRGYVAVVCETTDTWQDAITLYRRCGFAEVGHVVGEFGGDVQFRLVLHSRPTP